MPHQHSFPNCVYANRRPGAVYSQLCAMDDSNVQLVGMVALEFKIFKEAEVENHSERLECCLFSGCKGFPRGLWKTVNYANPRRNYCFR